MLTKREELEQLNKERLIDDYLLLEKRLETLERQMGELKRALGIKPRENVEEFIRAAESRTESES
ncbi:MAG: hypothetical protein Q9P01_01730 [Anaerolineae bacterium]|nr:hypothetical protein [Anaerolineae bacterium]